MKTALQKFNPSYHMLLGRKLDNNPKDNSLRIDREILELALLEMDKLLKLIAAEVKEEFDGKAPQDSDRGPGSAD